MTDSAETADHIYVSINRQQYGPIEMETLNQWLQERRIHASDWVWIESAKDWYPVAVVPQLSGLLYRLEEKPTAPPTKAAKVLHATDHTDVQEIPKIGTRVFFHDKQAQDKELLAKREMVRFSVTMNIKYASGRTDFCDINSFKKSKLLDISMYGMAFEVREYYAPGKTVKVVINFDTAPTPFQAIVKVIRCTRSLHDPDYYMLGGGFSHLGGTERIKLEKFIEYTLRLQGGNRMMKK